MKPGTFVLSVDFCILEAIKSWRCGRPGNEATNPTDTHCLYEIVQSA